MMIIDTHVSVITVNTTILQKNQIYCYLLFTCVSFVEHRPVNRVVREEKHIQENEFPIIFVWVKPKKVGPCTVD